MGPVLDIENQTIDREKFNDYVYTPVIEALAELELRQQNPDLKLYINKTLPGGVPEAMAGKKNMVLFRHIATSNYEIIRFVLAADALDGIQPLVLEYTEDKFLDRNEWKYSLGKISYYKGRNKLNEPMYEFEKIIDFNTNNNKPIHEIKTLWGTSLVETHHELLIKNYPHFKHNILDISNWLHGVGRNAKEYYKAFLTLFLRDGILFENFLLHTKELSFTQEIILPAINEIFEEIGVKPLIVALEPTEIEGDKFWLSHPQWDKDTLHSIKGVGN